MTGNGDDIDFLLPDQLIDERAFAESADEDYSRSEIVGLICDFRSAIGDALDIRLKILDRTGYAGVVVGIHVEGCCFLLFHYDEIVPAGGCFDVLFLA